MRTANTLRVRLCLYRHPTLTPEVPRLGLVRDGDVIDANGVCLASLLGHMRPKRAAEIADALCPPDLVSFLDGGRHAWNALTDSLGRLGPRLALAPPVTPDGDAVVVPKANVRLVPLVPSGAGWATAGFGEWQTTPVPSPGSDVIVALHTDARAHLPEYLAVVGSTIDQADASDAAAAIALVAIVRPSRPESACILLTPDEAEQEERGLLDAVTAAVTDASRNRTLLVGDIVRSGPRVVSAPPSLVDLREPAASPLADDIVPTS